MYKSFRITIVSVCFLMFLCSLSNMNGQLISKRATEISVQSWKLSWERIQDSLQRIGLSVLTPVMETASVTSTFDTLIYDNNLPQSVYTWKPGARMGTRFSPKRKCKLIAVIVAVPESQVYRIGVYQFSGGSPGLEIAETNLRRAPAIGWCISLLAEYNIEIDNQFIASFNISSSEPTAGIVSNSYNNGRSWDWDGSWTSFNETYFIRAIVEYQTTPTDVCDTEELEDVTLKTYPNPFVNKSTISYRLASSQNVTLSIFNSIGCLVEKIDDGEKQQGVHEVVFNASRLPTDLYFIRLAAGRKVYTVTAIRTR